MNLIPIVLVLLAVIWFNACEGKHDSSDKYDIIVYQDGEANTFLDAEFAPHPGCCISIRANDGYTHTFCGTFSYSFK